MDAPFPTVGRFVIQRRLDGGGMGDVYLANDPDLGRQVALKVLRPDLLDSLPGALDRFRLEARAVAALNHRNIVTLYDAWAGDGTAYIAMEYVPGRDLARLIAARTPFLLSKKLELAIDLCSAVAHAHAHGVLHRDIKPANVIVADSGTIKLVDFGIARVTGSAGLTTSGARMVTVSYSAPEVLQGAEPDSRSDIFALATTLFEWFSGTHPFRGDSEGATVFNIINRALPPLDIPGDNGSIAAVLRKALERNPADRYQDAATMRASLEVAARAAQRLFEETTVLLPSLVKPEPTAAPVADGTRWRHAAAIASAVAVLLLGLTASRIVRHAASPEPAAQSSGTSAEAPAAFPDPRPTPETPPATVGSVKGPRVAGRRPVVATPSPRSDTAPEDATTPDVVAPPSAPTAPVGTTLFVSLTESLSSAESRVGDSFRAVLDTPVTMRGGEPVPAGTAVTGRVQDVGIAGGQPFFELALEQVEIAGVRTPVHTGVYRALAPPPENGRRRPAVLVIAALAGGAAGAALAGNTGAVAGAALGAAVGMGGTSSAASTVVPGAHLAFRLAEPLRFDNGAR